MAPHLEAETAPTASLVEHAPSAYREDRAPVVVLVSRIDNTIAHLLRSNLAGKDLTAITRRDIEHYRAAREAVEAQRHHVPTGIAASLDAGVVCL